MRNQFSLSEGVLTKLEEIKNNLSVSFSTVDHSLIFSDVTKSFGCRSGCSGSCTGSCHGGCSGSCAGGCSGSCKCSWMK